MIGLGKVKKILGEKAKQFTAKQLEEIQAYLTQLALYNVEIINNQNRKDEESNING